MENLIDNKSYRETAEELKSKMYAKMNEIGAVSYTHLKLLCYFFVQP